MIIQNSYSQLLKYTVYKTFLQILFLSHFFLAIIFSEVPMWSAHFSHPNVMIPQKNDSRRVLNPEVTKLDSN